MAGDSRAPAEARPAGTGREAAGSLLGPALMLTSGRTLAFGAAFFIPVVLARVLTAEEFGTYKQIFLLAGTLYYAAQLGLATSLFYFVPRAPERAGRYVANALAVLLATGGLCAAVLASGREGLAWLFSNARLPEEAAPLAVYLLLLMLSAPFEVILISQQRYRAASWSYALSDVLRAAALIVPTLLTGEIRWLMLGAAAFALARTVTMLGYFRREFGAGLTPDPRLAREQLAYSLPFGFAVLVGTLTAHLHQYLVSHSFDAATFAVYAVGCLEVPLVDFLATPAGDVMMVRMTGELRDGRSAGARATWHEAIGSLAFLLFPLAGLLLLFARDLIVLVFTEAYVGSVPIFMLGTSAILLAPLLTDGVLRVYARTRFLLFLNALQLAAIAVLIRPFLALFGLPGAVLVTLAALALSRLLALVEIRRLLGVGLGALLPWGRLARLALAAAIAFGAGLAAKGLPGLPALAAALVAGLAFAAVYGALVAWWRAVPAEAGPALARWLGRLVPRRGRAAAVAAEAAPSRAQAG